MSSNKVELTKEHLEKEINEGSLFIKEELLDQLPLDWVNCILFTEFTPHKENNIAAPLLVHLDEDRAKAFAEFIKKDTIKLLVFNSEKSQAWVCLLCKIDDDNDAPTRMLSGGESLREYCDKKGIHYKSCMSGGKLISGTTLQWLKKLGEDCRIPQPMTCAPN